MLRKILALLLALVTVAALAACAPKTETPAATPSDTAAASPTPAADTPLKITDMTGRELTFDKPVKKIVVLTASDGEILYALGAGSMVVGRGEYCDYPAEITSVPSVQSGSDTNIEQIIALGPDAVLMSKMAQTQDQIDSLENAGIKVVMSDAQNVDGVYTNIQMIGQVVNKNDETKAIVDSMKKTFDDIKAKVPADSGKTIYFEVSPLQFGLYAAGSGTFMDEIAKMLGLKNAFADMEGWVQVSEEQVIQRNPDYIVTTAMSYDGSPNPIDEILGRKGWSDITAVKNKAIYNADANSSALMHPGPRLGDAATELYNFVYGN
jgi:iron complex transport system substrate-binding protein